MIQLGTKLKCIDNSGARIIGCIHVQSFGSVGDIVRGSVKKTSKLKKTIQKGDLCKALIVNTNSIIRRLSGHRIRAKKNEVILIDDKGVPVGTRILQPVSLELRRRGYLRVLSLATQLQ